MNRTQDAKTLFEFSSENGDREIEHREFELEKCFWNNKQSISLIFDERALSQMRMNKRKKKTDEEKKKNAAEWVEFMVNGETDA